MHRLLSFPAFVGLIPVALAATHDLIVGTFSGASLFTVRFDDEALTLENVGETTVPWPNQWIALSHDRKHLYGTAYMADQPGFLSYTLHNSTSIEVHPIIYAGGDCNGTGIYVEASPDPPYSVYGSFWRDSAGCGTVMSVDADGALSGVVQNFTYVPDVSAVHGTAFSPGSKLLYSADHGGNELWAHRVDAENGGRVVEPAAARLTATPEGAHPRHVVAHPGGSYLYAVYEGSSEVAQYEVQVPLDPEAGEEAEAEGAGIPSFAGVRYPLLRADEGDDPADFWADEVALSASRAYLWATNRARADDGKGYISVFSLDGAGAILRQNFLVETTSSGGAANAVTPSPFSDRFAALTDSLVGFLQIWSLDEDGNGTSVVATLDMPEGCCANAVWYS